MEIIAVVLVYVAIIYILANILAHLFKGIWDDLN